MTVFAQYLHLRDKDRDSLEPNPENDPDLYVDLDDIVRECEARLSVKAPKIILMGDYGTGKTHLLHVLMSRVDEDRFASVYIKLEPYGRWAESRHLHDAIVVALESSGLLIQAIRKMLELNVELDKDFQVAARILAKNPDDADARAWLLGRGPTPARARRVGFTGPLAATARGVTYAKMWRQLADALFLATRKQLLLFVDETETFQEQIDQARAADLGVAVREMFDAANKSFGVVMGLTAPKARGGEFSSHPLGRPDVATRVSDAIVRIGALHTPQRRMQFVSTLQELLIKPPHQLLSANAVELIGTSGHQIARMLSLVPRDPVQREYVKLLNTIALRCVQQRSKLPLSGKQVRELLGVP
jgi:hypothetical protein